MNPRTKARRMPRDDQEHGRTKSAKDATKARRIARRAKQNERRAA
jgi:hypothetical protein